MGWRDSRAHKGLKLCSLRFYLARQLKRAEDFQDFIKPWFWENIGPVNSKVTSCLLTGIFKTDTYPCFLSRVCPFSWYLNNSVHWRVLLGWLSSLYKLDSISMYVHAPTGPRDPRGRAAFLEPWTRTCWPGKHFMGGQSSSSPSMSTLLNSPKLK